MSYWLYRLQFPNGKIYLGISCAPAKRFSQHARRTITGSRLPVHCAFRKYGAENVLLELLCCGERKYIADLEVKMIAALLSQDRRYGYNVTPGGDLSPMTSKEVREKVSTAMRKRMADADEETKRRILAALHSPESRAKNLLSIRKPEVSAAKSAKLRGRRHSIEASANMKVAQNDEQHRESQRHKSIVAWASPELRAAQSVRYKGRQIPREQRRKISVALKGHPGFGKGVPRTEEVKRKISAAKMGHTVSAETRAKIKATMLARSQ